MNKKIFAISMLFVSSVAFTGCSGGGKPKTPAVSDTAANIDPGASIGSAPLTLTVYPYALGFADTEFNKFFADPVQKKYPNVTLQYVQPTQGNDPASLVAAGSVPDIVFTPDLNTFKNLGLLFDLNDFIKKYHVDLNNFDPTAIAAIKEVGDQGQMYAIPFSGQRAGLFYNKDIFDKFAVPYPTDGMTWDQAVEMGKKLTRTDGGVQYSGLHSEPLHTLATQLSLPYVDDKANKALLDVPGWKTILELVQNMYMNDNDKTLTFSNRNLFLKNQTLAMLPDWANDFLGAVGQQFPDGNVAFKWGVAELPTFKEAPDMVRADAGQHLLVTSTSQHKEQAFAVVDYLTSKEAQTLLGEYGRIPALKDASVQQSYGTQLKFTQGVNLQGIFKGKVPKPTPTTKLNSVVGSVVTIIDNAGNDVLKGKDVNTALRESQEAADIAIQKYLSGQ